MLAEFEYLEDAGLIAFDSIGFLMGEVHEEVAGRLKRARVFAGYAGWGPGQLEMEMAEEGGWIAEQDRVVVLNTGSGLKYPETVSVDVPVLPRDGTVPSPRR